MGRAPKQETSYNLSSYVSKIKMRKAIQKVDFRGSFLELLCRAHTWVRIFGKGQNLDLEARLGQNEVRIWFKSQNNGIFCKTNGFFVKYNKRNCFLLLLSAPVEIDCHGRDTTVCQI